MNDSPIPNLTTERLILRPFTSADAPTVQRLAGAAEVAATMLFIPHPYPDGVAELWITTHHASATTGSIFTWAITRQSDRTLMGSISLNINMTHGRGEIGYWLGTPYWRQGYMSEAAGRVIEYAFAVRDLHRVQATAFLGNEASKRVMEKVGMRHEGILRGYVRKGDSFLDVHMYAICRPS